MEMPPTNRSFPRKRPLLSPTMNLINQQTGRLTIATVERLESLPSGDPVTEEMILMFINDRYNANYLLYLPVRVAEEILKRPSDFILAAKQHCESKLPF